MQAMFARGVLTLLALVAGAAGEVEAADKPNIVVILADDLGWKDTAAYGSAYYETPNIDRLAADGVRFAAAYSPGPNCPPARASLLTGQYTPRHGVYTSGRLDRGPAGIRKLRPGKNRKVLPLSAITLAEALAPAGYTSANIGKWYLGAPPTYGPEAHGFDVNVAGSALGRAKSYFPPYGLPNIDDKGGERSYLTRRLTDEAIEFIDANANQRPFLLLLSHYSVHPPMQAPPPLRRKYGRKRPSGKQNHPVYAAMVEALDESVGEVVAALERNGLRDDTIIFFLSDVGAPGSVTSSKPLRGSKGMFYEGGIRVPFIVSGTPVTSPGTVSEVPVMSIDIYPTILELTGAPAPVGHPVDGESLVRLLRGESKLEREALFWHFPGYIEAGRHHRGFRMTPSGAIRMGDYKLHEFFETGRVELYNVAKDIGERRNLSRANAGIAARLRKRLAAWRESVRAEVPQPKDRPQGK